MILVLRSSSLCLRYYFLTYYQFHFGISPWHYSNDNFTVTRHGVKMGPGPQDLGSRGPRTRDPIPPSKWDPESPLKFKSGTPGPTSKCKSETPGPPLKFKSNTLVIVFLHCMIYFVLDKYIHNMEISFHE